MNVKEKHMNVKEKHMNVKEKHMNVKEEHMNVNEESVSVESDVIETRVFTSYYVRSGWMPGPGSRGLRKFLERIKQKETSPLDPSIEALGEYIRQDPTVNWMMEEAFKQNGIILRSPATPNNEYETGIVIPEIPDLDALLNFFNQVMDEIPQFADGDLVGLPFSAITVGIDPTLGGTAIFRLPKFNELMSNVLNRWNTFLGLPKSMKGVEGAKGFEGAGWLTPTAKKSYQFPLWKQDTPGVPPYWTTWNSFFTRQFEDKEKSRPIADRGSNQVVVSASDSSLYRWGKFISKENTFWFKDMPYSLAGILSSPDPHQQKVIDEYDLVSMFENGYIFQTYLNPYNYHRWWSPVHGKVLFDPLVIPGYFFSKLVIPDYGGATTESTPYLAQVNARGLLVIETKDYGNVALIPLGMSEVSTVTFHTKNVYQGADLKKGEEVGMFNYGGSSFALIFQDLEGKELVFRNEHDLLFPQQPQGASSSAGSGDYPTNIGSQIGVWKPRSC